MGIIYKVSKKSKQVRNHDFGFDKLQNVKKKKPTKAISRPDKIKRFEQFIINTLINKDFYRQIDQKDRVKYRFGLKLKRRLLRQKLEGKTAKRQHLRVTIKKTLVI